MSGFCVFGLTRTSVRLLAKQAVDRLSPPDDGWTPSSYAQAIAMQEAALLQKKHTSQISPTYSSPFRCKEFLELAHKNGELISGVIMYRGTTNSQRSNKKPVTRWLKYDGMPADASGQISIPGLS